MNTLFSLNHVGVQVVAMLATFLLCLTLGAERHLRHKDAGVKTHVLVGLGSCLFTLVSAYGFAPITARTLRWTPVVWPRRSSPASASWAPGSSSSTTTPSGA